MSISQYSPNSTNETWFHGATAPPPTPYHRVLKRIAALRRDFQNSVLAARYATGRTEPWPDHGYSVLGMTEKKNGLSRAYRYEIARLKNEGLMNPESRNLLILGQPRQWRRLFRSIPDNFAETYRVSLWVTEFDVFPPDWEFALQVVNEIWTPSEFSARAFRKATDIPVKVVPHAVSVGKGAPMERSIFSLSPDQFVGMAIMDVGACPDRKNPLAHIYAWQEAFGHNPNTQLLIKARFSRHKPFVREAMLNAIGSFNNIRIVESELSDAEMEAFQRMADVYVSLHRAEGYGLNIHQMLELGIPTIATGWSGNMDYMPRYAHAFAVPYRLIPYQDPTLYYRGVNLKWADVDINASARILRNIYAKHKPRSHQTVSASSYPAEILDGKSQ